MFTSRLLLLSAMTWTEKKRLCRELATLTQTHTRALPAAVVMVLLYCGWLLWCSYTYAKTKKRKRKKNVTKSKEGKELREGSPTTNFLVGNYGLRRAERWEDTPSMSSEVGEV